MHIYVSISDHFISNSEAVETRCYCNWSMKSLNTNVESWSHVGKIRGHFVIQKQQGFLKLLHAILIWAFRP